HSRDGWPGADLPPHTARAASARRARAARPSPRCAPHAPHRRRRACPRGWPPPTHEGPPTTGRVRPLPPPAHSLRLTVSPRPASEGTPPSRSTFAPAPRGARRHRADAPARAPLTTPESREKPPGYDTGDCTIASRTAMRKEHRRGTRDLRDLHKCYLPALTNVRTGGCDDAGFLDTYVRPRLDRNARRAGAAVRAGRYALPDHAALRARVRARSHETHAGGMGRDRLRQARPAARVHARSAGCAAGRPALRARHQPARARPGPAAAERRLHTRRRPHPG